MHHALEDASIGDITVDAATSSTASDCGKAPPVPMPVPVNPGIITIQWSGSTMCLLTYNVCALTVY
eukprot:6206-Heterococcus_DN1.PRE.3